ncbi:substrate-binding domain-containing protein [Pseudomonas sp. Hp2]|uniref:substrate-binding domain-containing protein n=1 Tax=Pseudomonas sp. Hp2 TaxID=701189 RepID=UPI0027401EFC|nr:substrate-binding domain-containing protein [Pseudomonas sp. Hp2]
MIMFKHNKRMAAALALGLLSVAGVASAQSGNTAVGGGATLPEDLYDEILPSGVGQTAFTYTGTGSGAGKANFLNDNPQFNASNSNSWFRNESAGGNPPPAWASTVTVHFAGSDSVLSPTEISTYNDQYNSQDGSPATIANYGNLVQIPSAATSVTVPFNKAGSALDLNVTAICGIFSGKFTNWNQVPNSGRTGTITVVYRDESSGTSELFTRFLTAACSASDVAGTTLKTAGSPAAPAFSVQSTFRNVFVNNTTPANFVSAVGGTAVYNQVYAVDGRIGYVGPDVIPDVTDATKVAKVKGFSPNEVSVQATLDTVAPPTGAAAANPANWVPTFGNPSAGYPIAGYTNLILGQCYANATVASNLLTFLRKHYNAIVASSNDAAIRAHGLIPLTSTWKTAIRNRFTVAGAPQLIGDTANGCAGVPGRPL